MANVMEPMQGTSSSQSNATTSETTDAWPSGDSTTSLTMDDDDAENAVDADSGGGSGSRKYERKTRRFAWPDELHRRFVAAIFDLGLKNASPKALMPFMEPTATSAGITSEHLKSHLQKYRLNYDKSRAEFLAFFDESAKRNGRRRRRTAKSTESHTRFIFPITPCPPGDPALDGPSAPHAKLDVATSQAYAHSPASPTGTYPSLAYSQVGSLSPRTRFDRANLLRLAQHNAVLAFASQSAAGGGYGAGYSPRDGPGGVDAVTDAQWGMLASLLSPPVDASSGSTPGGFSLNEAPSPDVQMQMHLAMQAQMNLHRQMLTRKVAVSQHYYNQAAAVKRAAASAMVERALQNAASIHQQAQQQQQPSGRYSDTALAVPPPSAQPHMGERGIHPHHHYQYQQQQQQQQQRYATSSQADALLGPPWDPMDIDMTIQSEEQADLFSFLKTTE